jgi:hypothetical protein
MPRLSALRNFLPLAALLAGTVVLLSATPGVQAQQGQSGKAEQGSSGGPNNNGPRHADRGVGFYSLTLSDIWGPAKMPPAPRDFGPHFDFPPEPLNGAPLHDPYPN